MPPILHRRAISHIIKPNAYTSARLNESKWFIFIVSSNTCQAKNRIWYEFNVKNTEFVECQECRITANVALDLPRVTYTVWCPHDDSMVYRLYRFSHRVAPPNLNHQLRTSNLIWPKCSWISNRDERWPVFLQKLKNKKSSVFSQEPDNWSISPLVPTISMCKWANPVAIDSVIASITFVSTVRIVKKSNNEPFSWKSVTSHNCVHVPLSEWMSETKYWPSNRTNVYSSISVYLCCQPQWIREYSHDATWPFDKFPPHGTMSTLRDWRIFWQQRIRHANVHATPHQTVPFQSLQSIEFDVQSNVEPITVDQLQIDRKNRNAMNDIVLLWTMCVKARVFTYPNRIQTLSFR